MTHRFRQNGTHIVLDSNSGAVHVVDPIAYEAIGLYEINTPQETAARLAEAFPALTAEEITVLLEDIESLQEQGLLYSPEADSLRPEAAPAREGVVKALCLHMAHGCNLACGYCFAGKGEYGDDFGLMPYEVGRQALEFLIAHSGGRKNLEVDFFGGEPLLNFEVIKQLVAYGRSREQESGKRFRFTLTTNGLLLSDEVMDFANSEMSNVVLSLDGRREVHDRFRHSAGGRGSYDAVVPVFQRMAALREQKNYYIRGTYTRENLDFAADALHMADLGFQEISMEPVVAPPEAPYALREEDVPVLCAEYEKLAARMLQRRREGKDFHFFHFQIDLENGPCLQKRMKGCGVGTEYLAVTPAGALYPCHQFVGNPDFRMGDVWAGVTETALRERFSKNDARNKPQCRDCFARLYCGGGCAANAYHASGDILGEYEIGCALHRKRVECAIVLQAAEDAEEDARLF